MKQRIILLLGLCTLLSAVCSAEQPRYTIQEVRAQAKALQEQSSSLDTIQIETRKGHATVRITLPEVDAVPVLSVALSSQEQLPEAPAGGDIRAEPVEGMLVDWVVTVEPDEGAPFDVWMRNTTRVYSAGPGAQADGSPLAMAEALAFAQETLVLYKDRWGWDFRLQRGWSVSRLYKSTMGRGGPQPLIDQPASDDGYYDLRYEQFFHGIPLSGVNPFHTSSARTRRTPRPGGELVFSVFAPNAYRYSISPARETGVLLEDIPLCSMATVLEALKAAQPFTLAPSELKLCYLPWNDPRWDDPLDPKEDYILLPAWLLLDADGGALACVSAQTGSLLDGDTRDSDGHRDDAVWIAW